MIRSKTVVVAVAAILALTALEPVGEAGAGDKNGNAAYCHWYRQLAMNTGEERWWAKWRRCIRGDYWD